MVDAVFAIPGDLNAATGGYGYSRRVLELMPAVGVNLSYLPLPGNFPDPSPPQLEAAAGLLSQTPQTAVILIDGLACGTLPPDVITNLSNRVIAVIHHPLALETGLSNARQRELAASEKAALAAVDHVIITGPAMKPILMDDYAVPEEKITVAEPGTDPAVRATGTGTPLQLLSVGAVAPRKGYNVLVEALTGLENLDWRLTIAGALDRDPDMVTQVKAKIAKSGLTDRITMAGVVVPATLERFYDSADLFVMPSLFEGYGMVLAEAMARGLPIVCTTGGAAGVTVPDAAAVKTPPGDADALREAIRTCLTDRKLRARLADESWLAGRELPTWNETARRVGAAILDIRT